MSCNNHFFVVHLLVQFRKRKSALKALFSFGGRGGIRTRGGLLTHTRFPGVRLKPLIHPSVQRSRAMLLK